MLPQQDYQFLANFLSDSPQLQCILTSDDKKIRIYSLYCTINEHLRPTQTHLNRIPHFSNLIYYKLNISHSGLVLDIGLYLCRL